MDRREFLKWGAATGAAFAISSPGAARSERPAAAPPSLAADEKSRPVVISTWKHGVAASSAAFQIMQVSGHCLDAVERGVAVVESDPRTSSVGLGGLPNAEGVVQLDAALMDGSTLEVGAVAGLERIENPVRVARKVMDETPHVLLVGDGARRFAVSQGFPERELLTEEAKKRWQEWRSKTRREPSGHDTVGAVALDRSGRMAAACTTSGLAWKLPGRVGDSPIVGAGLYCDGEVGGAVATGIGEEVLKVCGSFLVVELMRQGRSPQEAVEETLRRILRRDAANAEKLVAFCALRRDGETGAASTTPDFQVAIGRPGAPVQLVDAAHLTGGKSQG